MCVLHECDNPPCVRLDHLYLGTQALNMADKIERGRLRNGSRLPGETIRWIRKLLAAGCMRVGEIADACGVSRTVVAFIKAGRTWRSNTECY